jgi:beta-phosphoglucomutase family hydrolase
MLGVTEVAASRFDAVVFDMDGVITDTARTHARAWKRMFDEYLEARRGPGGFVPFSDDDYGRYVDGKHRDDGVASFLASRDIPLPRGEPDDPPDRETVWGLANRKDRDFQRALREEGARAFPSSVAFVRELQQRNIGTAVVSASKNCQRVLDAAGVGDLFPVRVDGIVAEELALPGKPEPATFLEAARRLGAVPARAAVIEDAIAGVEAGRRGRFALVVGVDRVGHAAALADAGADLVVADLSELRVGP